MLYLIGGAPRSGKSLLAERMVKEKAVPYFPLDALIGMLTTSAPEFEINHDVPFVTKGERAWKFTEKLFSYFRTEMDNYLIEGDCLLPQQVAILRAEGKENIRACFLGYTKLTAQQKLEFIRAHHRGEKDWTHAHADEGLLDMINRMITFSIYLKEQCEKVGEEFIDVSKNFESQHNRAYSYLNA